LEKEDGRLLVTAIRYKTQYTKLTSPQHAHGLEADGVAQGHLVNTGAALLFMRQCTLMVAESVNARIGASHNYEFAMPS